MSDPSDSSTFAYELPDSERPASAATSLPGIEKSARAHDPYAALRYPSFLWYMAGWAISVIGDQIMEVAVGWEVYQQTHNPMSLGWVGLVTALPVMVLALPAGHLADRVDRRKVIMLMQIFWSVCVVMMAVLVRGHGSIAMLYVLLLLAAVAKAISWPSRSALIPMIVPAHHFPNAATWNSSGFQLAAMIGPALGGFIVYFNVPFAFICAAAASVIFAISLLAVKVRPTANHREPATLKSLGAGVVFVLKTKIILATLTLDLFAVLLGGATYLLPAFATDILKVGATGFGWLRAAPALGAVVMALLVAHLPPMKRAGRAMLLAVAGFGAATIVFGLSHNFWLSMAMLFLIGAFDNISVVVRHTLVQVLTPDSMRGRVSAVNNVFIGASNELGGFESGITAKLFGTVPSVVAGGIGTVLVVTLVAYLWPQVRTFGSLNDAKPGQSG